MVNLLKMSGRLAGVLLAVGLAASAQQQQGRMAGPGTVNYIEGQVSLNGQTLSNRSIGAAQTAPGQVLETQNGRAEMLLTPGVFLRLNNNSAVRMVSPDLTNTQVELVKGQAMLEADYVTKDNHISLVDNGFTVDIEKNGVYNFDAARPMVSVYDGDARVTVNDKTFNVKKGKELALVASTQKPKEQDFSTNTPNQLYSWSKLRAGYMAQANQAMVQNIFVGGGYPGWWGGYGWYWDPYFDSFAFVPGYGYWGSPFGFGFYSPAYVGAYGFRGGYFGRSGYYRGVGAYRGGVSPAVGSFHGNGGFSGRAVSGGGGFGGGHAFGGGGFHGGGFGGGRR